MLGATAAGSDPNSAWLMDAATARRSPSTRCPYTSFVMVMLACPKISDTTCSGVPWASISEAPECRSSCGCQRPSPALLHSLAKGAREVLRVERCPGLASEDQSVVPRGRTGCHLVGLPGVMLAQLGQDLWGQRERPPRAGSFQLADDELGPVARLSVTALDPLDAMSDLNGPGVPIKGEGDELAVRLVRPGCDLALRLEGTLRCADRPARLRGIGAEFTGGSAGQAGLPPWSGGGGGESRRWRAAARPAALALGRTAWASAAAPFPGTRRAPVPAVTHPADRTS